ncbi:CdaR family protein [Filobacillus milosensis]|nr:CdaR family protein [Filobacillus milosensis]
MDRWIKSPWFTRIVSLFLALLLYMTVALDEANTSRSSNTFLPTGSTDSETMTNVPLQVELDEENYVVRGVPDTVEVTLEGPSSSVTQAVRQRNFEVFIDLNGLQPGTHEVDIKHSGIPSQITVYIEPRTIEVTIEDRANVSRQVELEYVGKNGIDESEVFASPPAVSPEEVEITGAKTAIDRIGIVKAIVNFSDLADDGIARSIPVKVYDAQGNELSVFINPSTVTVEADVSISDKRLPINYETTGELSEDLVLRSINVTPVTATLFGTSEVLNDIDQLEPIEINLSEITQSTTIDAELNIPSGVRKVEPEKVSVEVFVEEAEERLLEDMEINVDNLSEGQEITFLDPEEPLVDVTAIGKTEDIEQLNPEDIRVSIDVSDYVAGEFYADVLLEGPENVRLRTNTERVRVRIE